MRVSPGKSSPYKFPTLLDRNTTQRGSCELMMHDVNTSTKDQYDAHKRTLSSSNTKGLPDGFTPTTRVIRCLSY